MSRKSFRGIFFIPFSVETLFELLPISISGILPASELCELRLRLDKPLYFYDGKKWSFAKCDNETYVVSRADIDYILGAASGYSVYAVSDNLLHGFIPWKGGVRIGVTGEGVMQGAKLHAVKNVSSLAIRVPSERKGAADGVIKKIFSNNNFKNTLIISPTGAGKTTLLREIARLVSNGGLNTLIIDERFELSAPYKGKATLDVGRCADVVAGVPKTLAVEVAVRCMNPDVIICDEIYGEAEISAVTAAVRAGVKIAASLHANGAEGLENDVYKPLLDAAEVIVTLTKTPRVGAIKRITVK